METTKVFKKFLTDNQCETVDILIQVFEYQNKTKLCQEYKDVFQHFYKEVVPRKNAKKWSTELFQELTKVVVE